jgi:pyruvate dehydrogenase (quinone)
MTGDPKFDASQRVPAFPFAKYAEDIGLVGIKVDKPEQVGPAWDTAFAASRPVVLETVTDPEVPTLPPHITLKQARNFATTVPKEHKRAAIIRGTVKDVMAGILPNKD